MEGVKGQAANDGRGEKVKQHGGLPSVILDEVTGMQTVVLGSVKKDD